jgi:hypothetical protein
VLEILTVPRRRAVPEAPPLVVRVERHQEAFRRCRAKALCHRVVVIAGRPSRFLLDPAMTPCQLRQDLVEKMLRLPRRSTVKRA